MMVLGAEAARRYRVLQRSHRLPEPLIERFHAGAPILSDRFRLRAGAPPVKVGCALQAPPETALARRMAL